MVETPPDGSNWIVLYILEINPYSLPAIMTLFLKALIFLYARYSKITSTVTHLFLFLLFALAIQNLGEIWSFYEPQIPAGEIRDRAGGTVYFAASIAAIAVLTHLALSLSGWTSTVGKLALIYAPAVMFEILLIFTPYMIQGFTPERFTYTRVPGPAYLFFTFYALGFLTFNLVIFYRNAFIKPNGINRIRNRWIFYIFLPAILFPITVLVLQQLHIKSFSLIYYYPWILTLFLAGTAYATLAHRIFDISLINPWSSSSKQKKGFYQRVRSCMETLSTATTPDQALASINNTLSLPIAFVNDQQHYFAGDETHRDMVNLQRQALPEEDRLLVRRELPTQQQSMQKEMQSHGVAAALRLPIPGSDKDGWLYIGDAFDEKIQSPKDFGELEPLLNRLSHVLIKLNPTALSPDQSTTTEHASPSSTTLSSAEYGRLLANKLLHPIVTYVGKDQDLIKKLKRTFSYVQTYPKITSIKFRSRLHEDVLIVDESTLHQLPDDQRLRPDIIVCYGATDFSSLPAKNLLFVSSFSTDEIIKTVSEHITINKTTLRDELKEVERSCLVATLTACKGHQAHTAAVLGLAPSNINTRLKQYKINVDKRVSFSS